MLLTSNSIKNYMLKSNNMKSDMNTSQLSVIESASNQLHPTTTSTALLQGGEKVVKSHSPLNWQPKWLISLWSLHTTDAKQRSKIPTSENIQNWIRILSPRYSTSKHRLVWTNSMRSLACVTLWHCRYRIAVVPQGTCAVSNCHAHLWTQNKNRILLHEPRIVK